MHDGSGHDSGRFQHAKRAKIRRTLRSRLVSRNPFAVPEKLMISVSNVSMRYGAKILFEEVSTAFTPGKRFGLGAGHREPRTSRARSRFRRHSRLRCGPIDRCRFQQTRKCCAEQRRCKPGRQTQQHMAWPLLPTRFSRPPGIARTGGKTAGKPRT